MPEGDTVLRTARRLDAALAGRALVRAELRWPDLGGVDLAGRRVSGVTAGTAKAPRTSFEWKPWP